MIMLWLTNSKFVKADKKHITLMKLVLIGAAGLC